MREKLVFCHYHYEKSKHPKFYNSACKMLERAKNCAFVSQADIELFFARVKNALEMSKPEGHRATVQHNKGNGGGQITVVSGKLDDDVARLYYQRIEGFLEYDLCFSLTDVSERYEEGGSHE